MGTLKYLIVTMPDHSRWRIPARFIAEHRARYYVELDGDPSIFEKEVAFALADDYEITDWASNNMDWADVVSVAEKFPRSYEPYDYERAWPNADKEAL